MFDAKVFDMIFKGEFHGAYHSHNRVFQFCSGTPPIGFKGVVQVDEDMNQTVILKEPSQENMRDDEGLDSLQNSARFLKFQNLHFSLGSHNNSPG